MSTAQEMRKVPVENKSGQTFVNSEMLIGRDLEGREILICWDDGVWYDAVVVRYYPVTDEYKMVYRADDGIEIAKLRDRRWILAPKKVSEKNRPVLDGALIDFEYPSDGKRYRAMIYDYSHRGERLKIAYIEEHTTDNLKGGGWDFVTTSPCLDDSPREETDMQSISNLRSAGDDEGEDAKEEPSPVDDELAAKAPAAAPVEKSASVISKRRRNAKTSTKNTRKASTSSASRSSTRVSSRTRRSAPR